MNSSEISSNKSTKRKHITLTIQEKLEIINLVESNKFSRQEIAQRYGIGKSTVHDIHKRRDQIRRFAISNSSDMSKRRRVDMGMRDECETDYSRVEIEKIEEVAEMNEDTNFELVDDSESFEVIYQEEKPQNSYKRRSTTLTIRQKYEILTKLDEGMSVQAVCAQYAIGRTTVYDFIKRKQSIIDYIEKSSDETRRTFKKSNYPQVERSMIEWCENRFSFTKQDFFDACKENFAKVNTTGSTTGHFCGSWSWCKRFFDRHPQFKAKLVKSDGKVVDRSELSVSKEQERRLVDHVQYPELELELLKWCVNNKRELKNVLIQDIARCIFEELQLKGNFNPSMSWVRNFIARHPEVKEESEEEELIKEEFEEEFIVEEIEVSEGADELFEVVEEEEEENISNDEAANCLKSLLNFARQKDNEELHNLLLHCRDQLEKEGISNDNLF